MVAKWWWAYHGKQHGLCTARQESNDCACNGWQLSCDVACRYVPSKQKRKWGKHVKPSMSMNIKCNFSINIRAIMNTSASQGQVRYKIESNGPRSTQPGRPSQQSAISTLIMREITGMACRCADVCKKPISSQLRELLANVLASSCCCNAWHHSLLRAV